MKVPFKIYYPGGNTTALVFKIIPKKKKAGVALDIMQANKKIEQVGFIEKPKKTDLQFHLEMMGGEFCGNAARCAAFASAEGKKNLRFTVSGFKQTVAAHIQKDVVTLELQGEFFKNLRQVKKGTLVDLSGIRFLITKENFSFSTMKKLVNMHKANFPAFGVCYVQSTRKGLNLVPWVWVKATKSFVKETGCASGSIAAALALFFQKPSAGNYAIKQPSGGVYNIKIKKFKDRIKTISLQGAVSVI